MSLIMHTTFAPRIRYSMEGDEAEALRQIIVLTQALRAMTPYDMGSDGPAHWRSEAMASLSLQVMALIRDFNVIYADIRSAVASPLGIIYRYLEYWRDRLVEAQGISEQDANVAITNGHDYFEYDWPVWFNRHGDGL
jgi:hypothetical protein